MIHENPGRGNEKMAAAPILPEITPLLRVFLLELAPVKRYDARMTKSPSAWLFVFPLLMAPSAWAATFIADGVDPDDLAREGSRFYDAGKGLNWLYYNSTLKDVWGQDKDWHQLGDLAQYATTPTGLGVTGGYKNLESLRDDQNKCWAYTSSNVIQYWQDVYGQFYKGSEPLRSGLTYSRENLEKFGGTQSTAISLLLYKNTADEGGDSTYAFEWYLRKGFTTDTNGRTIFTNKTSQGGFFSDYFTSNGSDGSWTFGYKSAGDLKGWANSFATALGCTLGADGNYHTTDEGQIAYVSLLGTTGMHAVTCYGFETNKAGELSAVYFADSDNQDGFKLEKLYVGENAALFKDAAHTDAYGFQISNLAYINTPASLKRLLAGSRSDSLLWDGGDGIWLDGDTGSSHWEAQKADGSSTDAAFTNGKTVRFAAASNHRQVTIDSDITAKTVTVETAQDKTDTFAKGKGTVIHAEEYVKEGAGLNIIDVKLDTQKATIRGGEAWLAQQGSEAWQLTSLTLADGATVTVCQDGMDGSTGAITLGAGARFEAGKGATLYANLLLNGATLALSGALELGGSALTLGGGNTLLLQDMPAATDYILATGVGSLDFALPTRGLQALSAADGATAGTLEEGILIPASDIFTNVDGSYMLYYSRANNGTLGMRSAPEPATGTLSIAALALLAARRRRR